MDKKTLWVGLGSLMLIVLAVLATIWFGKPASFRGTSYGEPYPVAPAIELTRADGDVFRDCCCASCSGPPAIIA